MKVNWDKYLGSTKGEKIWNIFTTYDVCLFYNFFFYLILLLTTEDRFDFCCWSSVFVYNSWCTIAYHNDPDNFAITYKSFLKQMFSFFFNKFLKVIFSLIIMACAVYSFYMCYNFLLEHHDIFIKVNYYLTTNIWEISCQIFIWGNFALCMYICYWSLFFGMQDISNVFLLDYEKTIKITTGIQISICIIMISLSLLVILYGMHIYCKSDVILEYEYFKEINLNKWALWGLVSVSVLYIFTILDFWPFCACGYVLFRAYKILKTSPTDLVPITVEYDPVFFGAGFLGIILSIYMIFLIFNFRIKELKKGVA